ncbi:sigma factor [Streptomyces sp. NPDC045369]|uniref:sigma factor n=1 Tax=Streptomyces sp. NPDC045369 TaxID=3155732 RepID=UPI00340BE03C
MSEASAGSPASAADDYTRLYEREHPRLVAYARSLTTSAWLAEDLVAEAHFRVWRRIRSGHRIDNVPAYLRTTIRHLASAVGAAAAREIPQDPEDGQAWAGTGPAAEHADPAQRVAYVDLLARVMGRLPQRWVTALWLAEAEDQPLEAVGKAIGAGKGATAVLLHRAREGMRQAFLGSVPGTPDDPACEVHWQRMPAYVRGEATAKQADGVTGHLADCPDCRARMALLTRANDRLPALTGPALLVLLAGGSAKFLLPLAGAGAAAAGGAHAAGSGAATSVQKALTAVQKSVRHLLRGQIGQAGPVAATAAGVGVAVVAGVAVAAGIALTGGDAAPTAGRTAAVPDGAGGGTQPGDGADRAVPDATAERSATSVPTGAPAVPSAPAARGTASTPPVPRAGGPTASPAPGPSGPQAPAPSATGRPGSTPAPTGPAASPTPDPTASGPTGGPTPTPEPTGGPTARPTPTRTPVPRVSPTPRVSPPPTTGPTPPEHCRWSRHWGPVRICRIG